MTPTYQSPCHPVAYPPVPSYLPMGSRVTRVGVIGGRVTNERL